MSVIDKPVEELVEPEVLSEEDEALIKMENILNNRGWCQNALENDQGEVCLIGAMFVAQTGQTEHMPRLEGPYKTIFNRLLYRLGVCGVAGWNNKKGRTKAEVINMLRELRSERI